MFATAQVKIQSSIDSLVHDRSRIEEAILEERKALIRALVPSAESVLWDSASDGGSGDSGVITLQLDEWRVELPPYSDLRKGDFTAWPWRQRILAEMEAAADGNMTPKGLEFLFFHVLNEYAYVSDM
jgi:hypothetical protein